MATVTKPASDTVSSKPVKVAVVGLGWVALHRHIPAIQRNPAFELVGVIDLGCGDGKLTAILLDEVGPRRLVGIDLDPLETAAARRFPFYERVHNCPGNAIPEPEATFDFVLSNSVLEHIPDLEKTIAEAARALKPQGRFVFTVPGPAFHTNLAGSLSGRVPRESYLATLDRRLAHHHYLSKSEWVAMCQRNDLVLDDCLGYLDRKETQRWESLSRATGGLLYNVFGERQRPIEIQRAMGARALQTAARLPAPVASGLASIVALGLSGTRTDTAWMDPAQASCLLIAGHRS